MLGLLKRTHLSQRGNGSTMSLPRLCNAFPFGLLLFGSLPAKMCQSGGVDGSTQFSRVLFRLKGVYF